MTTIVFVALARGDQQNGYTARIADLPACEAAGSNMAELLAQAREAAQRELQRLADAGLDWPEPTPLERVAAEPGAVPFLVDVSVEDTPVRVNISIGERLLRRIDEAAESRGMSRSGFIATAARAALGERARGGADLDAIARKLQDEWTVLGRKITDSLGPDSAFNRNVTELDNRLTETIRKTAESVSAAMARRKEADARSSAHERKDQQGADPAAEI